MIVIQSYGISQSIIVRHVITVPSLLKKEKKKTAKTSLSQMAGFIWSPSLVLEEFWTLLLADQLGYQLKPAKTSLTS